jgi:hypothetical protein
MEEELNSQYWGVMKRGRWEHLDIDMDIHRHDIWIDIHMVTLEHFSHYE